MRARVITSKAEPDLLEQWIQLTRDVLVPASKSRDGFAGYIAIYDREGGTAVAVTLWEDERTERDSDIASREAREGLAKAVGADLRVDHYDVAIVEMSTNG